MNKKIRSAYVKNVADNKITAAVATTSSVDRDGDVVDPMGVDLKNFLKNPVLLWGHDAYSLPIGKVTNVNVSSGDITFDAEFASKENDFAKKVFDLMKGGFLNAFSIGFIPHERENEVITRSELLEISVVNVPANPEALMSREYKSFKKELEQSQKLELSEKDLDAISNKVANRLKPKQKVKVKSTVQPLTKQQKKMRLLKKLTK